MTDPDEDEGAPLHLIRYTTVSHIDWDGPFDSLEEARRVMRENAGWYRSRLACIVFADPAFPDDIKRAEALECVDD